MRFLDEFLHDFAADSFFSYPGFYMILLLILSLLILVFYMILLLILSFLILVFT